MREIRFRAWDKVENRGMFYGGFTVHATNGEIESDFYNSENLIIMQFTGLKDKNGNDIYEGDILGIDNEVIAPVTFEDGSYQIISLREQGRSPLIQDRSKRLSIIGNIHQNPELLES